MSELITLARPYAKAAFEFASANNNLAGWAKSLSLLAAVVDYDNVKKLLASPAVNSEQKQQAICDICDGELDDKMANFLAALSQTNRLTLLPEIESLFLEFKSNYEKSIDVSVTAAYAVSDETKNKLAEALKHKLLRDVVIDVKVDSELLGGALIRAGDTIIDGSVRGRLAKLTKAMNP